MEATDKSGENTPLRYLHASKEMSMIVTYLAPNYNNIDQVKYKHNKATACETSKREGGVQHNKAWKGLNYTILQTMKYHLPAMIINDKECEHIM